MLKSPNWKYSNSHYLQGFSAAFNRYSLSRTVKIRWNNGFWPFRAAPSLKTNTLCQVFQGAAGTRQLLSLFRKRLLSASLARLASPRLHQPWERITARGDLEKAHSWYLKDFICAPLSRQNDEFCQASASVQGQIQTNRKGHFQHLLWQEIHYSAQSSQSYTLREKKKTPITADISFMFSGAWKIILLSNKTRIRIKGDSAQRCRKTNHNSAFKLFNSKWRGPACLGVVQKAH